MEAFLCLENQQFLRPGGYKAIDEKQEQIHAKHRLLGKREFIPPALLGMQILGLKLLSPEKWEKAVEGSCSFATPTESALHLALFLCFSDNLETLFLTGTRAVATALFSVALLIS